MASNGPDRAVQWIRDSWTEVVPGRYRFEKFLGGGARGRAWLIQELNDGNPVRRFVVKYADDDIGVPTVEKEIRFLRQLQGHAHIVQPIAANGRLIGPAARERGDDGDVPRFWKAYVAMEYLENGSLDRFIERSRDRSSRGLNPVPNRVLWFIFMCSRMVVAMSRPASGSTAYRSNAQTALEEPRIFDTMNGQQIYHGDLVNTKNLMYGGYDSEEHSLAPILKAIDFGEGTDDIKTMKDTLPVTADTISQGNIFEIGQVMQMLYGHFSAPNFQMFQALRPNLDKDIYDLACACVDKDHKKRPTAYQLFERIRNNISNKKGPADFPGKPFAEWESDEKIRAYMEEMLALDT